MAETLPTCQNLWEEYSQKAQTGGLTQEGLSEALGITGAPMSRIESGQTTPRFSRLEHLADALKCQVADLFRSQEQPLGVRLDTMEDMLHPLSVAPQEEFVQTCASVVGGYSTGEECAK